MARSLLVNRDCKDKIDRAERVGRKLVTASCNIYACTLDSQLGSLEAHYYVKHDLAGLNVPLLNLTTKV